MNRWEALVKVEREYIITRRRDGYQYTNKGKKNTVKSVKIGIMTILLKYETSK